ncbi:hypothetical protein BFJ63_vAg18217 [Fusarium oxysporum f. sp. narcissi]|uniref:Uncharacterized protein n=1 Tax=Fusarium oxysporum f. sp. narcissi TaxID=451672 RepID=A0A4Q2V4X4_FUSOX|nr:hypothetical protein BFJ63_vAg18217 [Fusarium oxysporum f. sp. narcissi]
MATSIEASDFIDWGFGQAKKSKKSKKKLKASMPPLASPPPVREIIWDTEKPAEKVSYDDEDRFCEPEAATEYDLSARDTEPSQSCDIPAPGAKEEPISGKPDECEAAVEAIPGTSDWDFVAAAEPSVDDAPTEGRFWPEEDSAAAETEPTREYEEPAEEARPADEEENGEPKPDDGYMQEGQKIASLPFSSPYRLMAYLQQILEEACFACGRKTWPELLRKHNWDCVEAVSLTMWVKELEHLQHTSDMQPSRGLLQSIAEVQTIAIERRPINWPRMKKFFDDAVELTEMLNVKEYGEIITDIRLNIGKTVEGLSRNEEEAQSQAEKNMQCIIEERRKLDEREAEVQKGKEKSTKEFRRSAEREVKRVLEEAKKTLETTAFFSSLETKES